MRNGLQNAEGNVGAVIESSRCKSLGMGLWQRARASLLAGAYGNGDQGENWPERHN